MPKIVILVLAHQAEPWRSIQEYGQRNTWAAYKHHDVKILFYHSDPCIASPFVTSDELVLPGEEGILNIGRKTLAAFKYVIDNYTDTDYVFRTNSSSYVHIPGLLSSLENCPSTGVLRGLTWVHEGHLYVSGCGYLLSTDLVRLVVDSADTWDHSLVDDIALSRIVIDLHGITPVHCLRGEAWDLDSLYRISTSGIFHYRLKSTGERRFEIDAMNYVHSLYTAQTRS